MEQLSGQDASFLYFETPSAPMHIGGIAIYDPSTAGTDVLRFKDILHNIERRLHLARSFRQKVVRVPFDLDHPYWVEDPDFDLEYHVRHIKLPAPGDWRQLCIQTARLHSRPLDLSRPLWEMTVIEGLDNVAGVPKGSFAIVTKNHHAAIDGVSGAEMIAALHDLTPDAEPPDAEEPWVPERDPNAFELFARTTLNNVRQPFRMARVLTQSLPAAARLTAGLTSGRLRSPEPVPRTRFNGSITPHRVVEGRRFSLSDVRQIKKRVEGATVNDAVLALCGGALRLYLDEKGELPEESLVAMAPISVRDEGESGIAGNRVSGMIVPIRTEIEGPLERLEAVAADTKNSKALTHAVGARLLMDANQFLPGTLAGLGARLYTRAGLANRMRPFANTVITNVPGPQIPLYSAGSRLVTQFGTGPIFDGMGLIHPVFSYCGEITVSVTSCRELMPDPERYADCLDESFRQLRDAAGV